MMNTHRQPPISEPLRTTAIPIAQIAPEVEGLSERSVHAVVTLVWPYSSSTRSFSLLLAEPDFRLRRTNGQVKVAFHGHVAEAVAKSQIGIGDHVFVGLAGSRLVANETKGQTPGKCVPWDVHFDDRVLLEIWRSSHHFSTVKLDPPSVPELSTDDTAARPATPTANGRDHLGEFISIAGPGFWKSPAFVERTRTSFGGAVDSAYDPFAEEDGFVPGKGRKRPRFSLRGGDWRVIDEPASPSEKEVPADWTWIFDEVETLEPETDGEDHAERAAMQQETITTGETPTAALPTADMVMDVDHDSLHVAVESPEPPIEQPAMPEPQFLQKPLNTAGLFQRQDVPESPLLYPIPSPGLPVPSPLVTTSGNAHDYFPSTAPAISTQSVAEELPVEIAVTEDKVVSSLQPDVSVAQEPEPVVLTSELATETIESASEPPVRVVDFQALDRAFTAAADIPREVTETASQQNESARPSVSILGEAPSDATKLTDVPFSEAEHIDAEVGPYQTGLGQQNIGIRGQRSLETSEEESSEGEEEADEGESEVSEEEEEPEAVDERRHLLPPESSTSRDSQPGDTRGIIDSDIEEIAVEARGAIGEDIRSDTGTEVSSSLEGYAAREYRDGRTVETKRNALGDGYDDEEMYDEEEFEDEEEREDAEEEPSDLEDERDMYEHDYDGGESEYESESGTESPIRPQKIVHPEVIVLDSDIEDEPSAGPLTHTHTRSTEDVATAEHAESSASSAEEDDVSGETSADSEAEEWSEDEDESIVSEQTGDEQEEAEFVQGIVVLSDSEEDQEIGDSPREEFAAEEEHVRLHRDIEQGGNLPEPVRGQIQPSPEEMANITADSKALQATVAISRNQEALGDVEYGLSAPLPASQPHAGFQDALIDPELYRIEVIREDNPEVGPQAETKSQEPGFNHEVARFDGAASPLPARSPTHLAPHLHIPSPQAQQLVTPDASQMIAVDGQAPGDISMGGVLPTPEYTQDIYQNLSPQHRPHFTDSIETAESITTAPMESDLMTVNEDHVEMSSISAEQQDQDQGQVSAHDRQYVMSSSEDETQEVHDWDDSTVALEKAAPAAVDRYYPGLRSRYSYFSPLATLVDHFNSLTDTISIVTEVSPISQAASGKKDFTMTLLLTDPSMAGTTVVAQIFRPYKTALPSLGEGDAILLRDFQVKSFNHSMMLVSMDTSAWAVFNGSEEGVQITGPPVEYGDEENVYAADLRQWYYEDGIALVADYQLQAAVRRASRETTPVSSAAPSESVYSPSREVSGESAVSHRSWKRRKSSRRITIHELRDGRRYTEVGSPTDKESIHELRDGTVYANL